MSRKHAAPIGRGLVASFLLSLALPALASAQGGPGFLFKQPTVTIKFETGYGVQRANSEIFDHVFDRFVKRDSIDIGRRDFDAPYIGGEIAFRASERWDVALGVGWVNSSVDSEFRAWVDLDDLPIEQVTTLLLVPITLSAKYYFRDRGRTVGRFAWVPNALTPYVGAGVGIVHYRFEQEGDFVDFETFDIFYDRFTSQGEAPLLRGLAGLSLSVGKQFELSGEVRYDLASPAMGSDFEDFDPLDLNGFRGLVGIAIRF